MDDDRDDALMTDDEARDELGDRAYDEAMEAGELRRVTYRGDSFVLRGDVQRACDDRDPRKLADRVPRL